MYASFNFLLNLSFASQQECKYELHVVITILYEMQIRTGTRFLATTMEV